jgi:hypothetical protein
MKVQKISSGVYRFEPEESDVPVWERSKEQLRRRGWSAQMLDLVQPYLRPRRDVVETVDSGAEDSAATTAQVSTSK